MITSITTCDTCNREICRINKMGVEGQAMSSSMILRVGVKEERFDLCDPCIEELVYWMQSLRPKHTAISP